MQPDRIRQNLIAHKKIDHSKAFILLEWNGKSINIVEGITIESEDELERFVLQLAAEGNKLLRRLLKHRLEHDGRSKS